MRQVKITFLLLSVIRYPISFHKRDYIWQRDSRETLSHLASFNYVSTVSLMKYVAMNYAVKIFLQNLPEQLFTFNLSRIIKRNVLLVKRLQGDMINKNPSVFITPG